MKIYFLKWLARDWIVHNNDKAWTDKAEAEKERDKRNNKRTWIQRVVGGNWVVGELELIETNIKK